MSDASPYQTGDHVVTIDGAEALFSGPAVRGLRPPGPGRGQGADGVPQAEEVSEEPLPTERPRAPGLVRMAHGDLAYVDEGPRDAPALFAVHGVPGSVRDFRYLAPQLTGDVRFVRVDLPGFGGSAPVDDGHPQLRAAAPASCSTWPTTSALDRFAILGHSMGGGTALVLASRHRERVPLLVLVASLGLSRHRGLGLRPRAFRLLGARSGLPRLGPSPRNRARRAYRRRRFPGADS